MPDNFNCDIDVPLDADLSRVLSHIDPSMSSLSTTDPVELRRRHDEIAMATRAGRELPAVGSVTDAVAHDGGLKIPLRIYRPVTPGPHPTLLYLHGGGFVMGSIDTNDVLVRHFCRDLDAVIVSVEYRLAPEATFPAAHEDALTSALWAAHRLPELGGNEIFGLIGESAGANLAASTAIAFRDRQLPISGQLLIGLCCKDWRQSEVGCRSAPIRRLLRNGG